MSYFLFLLVCVFGVLNLVTMSLVATLKFAEAGRHAHVDSIRFLS